MVKSVNSLSGGKTSSYMAVHYPADYNIFALVTIEDQRCSPPEWLRKKVSDKIGKEFIATAEDDKTLIAVLELEQKIGKEITWVTGLSFDKLIKKKGMLPNLSMRYCTTFLKIMPITQFIYDNIIDKDNPTPVQMNIGFRIDEIERRKKDGRVITDVITSTKNGRNKWLKDFHIGNHFYPLIDDRIGHYTVSDWAKTSGINFPLDSNCVGCFWKETQQLRKNYDDNPEKMNWFNEKEKERLSPNHANHYWKSGISYEQIKTIGLQTDFFFGTGAGCQAGYCTD